MEVERPAITEDRERELIVKALTIAIAALDLNPQGLAAEDDRRNMARLLTRLANEGEFELYRHYAMAVISGIVDRQGRSGQLDTKAHYRSGR